MVKLAHNIGATSIAQTQRLATNIGSSVIEVRQGTWDDVSARHSFRVMPFTDIQYSGAEVAAMNSVIASCLIPTVNGVSAPKIQMNGSVKDQQHQGYLSGPEFARSAMTSFNRLSAAGSRIANDDGTAEELKAKWPIASGFGMSDYMMGYSATASALSTIGDFNKNRAELWSRSRWKQSGKMSPDLLQEELSRVDATAPYVEGTFPVTVAQFDSEDQALDSIANNPSTLTIGYVVSGRDVKMYFTHTAISMMVRRLHRIVEMYGPYRPTYSHIGLGHCMSGNRPFRPSSNWTSNVEVMPDVDSNVKGKATTIKAPSLKWSAGNVAYARKTIPAAGTLYIPQDQVPYGMMKRSHKYNHILTQLGLELMETLQAIGADLSSAGATKATKSQLVRTLKYSEKSSGAQIAVLQLMLGSMFGSVRGGVNTDDFSADPTSIAESIKENLGMFFNSGHIHVDAGAMTYIDGCFDGTGFTNEVPRVDGEAVLTYRGQAVSAATLMGEFIQKYFTFLVACQAFRPHFQMPLYDCHWLYVGSPKPEYVIEQLQMNYRPDVHFDGGGSGSEYTLVPTRLNPGEILQRIPCLFNAEEKEPNTYLGIRDPLPYGAVQDIRFHGDKPLTEIQDAREYDFTPIIEADASVMQTTRNGRTINISMLPRPHTFYPGVSPLGVVASSMMDNAGVGGSYYFQFLSGPYFVDQAGTSSGATSIAFRQVGTGNTDNTSWQANSIGKQDAKDQSKMIEATERSTIKPASNPQTIDKEGFQPVLTGGPALSYTGQAEIGGKK